MAKIAIIEDDKTLRESIEELITSAGYNCQSFDSAESFFWSADLDSFCLLLVDRNLPGKDGVSLVKQVREKNEKTAIIFLSSALSDEEVVEGLEAGANDYVTKPFTENILLARVRSALRVQNVLQNHDADIGVTNWTLDETSHEVKVGGKRYSLSKREFQIFKALSNKRGHVVARDEVLDLSKCTNYRNVDVHIVSLRKKIDPSGIAIQTIRGVGYRVG